MNKISMNDNSDEPLDSVFHALAHSIRRQILDYVLAHPGCSAGDISQQFQISRIAVGKHIKILQQAELLVIEKSGRTSLHYFNAMPIQMIYDRWTDEYSQFFASHLNAFKLQIESEQESDQTEDCHEKTA